MSWSGCGDEVFAGAEADVDGGGGVALKDGEDGGERRHFILRVGGVAGVILWVCGMIEER